MVTKQQQLEWLAKNLEKWNSGYDFAVVDKCLDGSFYVRWPSVCSSGITKKEWQHERDKMNSKPEIDNSWHERGEFPPVGCECEYNDAAWGFEDVSVTPMDGDNLTICAKSKTPLGHECVIFTWVSKNKALLAAAAASPDVFRPLCTEREKAIEEMANLITKSVFGSAKCQAEKLYDAGYRKEKP